MPGIDLNYFIRQANKLTEKIEAKKKELAEMTVEAQAGDGRVTVTATGAREIRSIRVAKELIDPNDAAMLEDLIAAAVNAALEKARELEKDELAKVTGGVKIPGLT